MYKFLPPELKSKIQNNFDSIYDFVNYCQSDKKTKKFCIDEYKRILTNKGYINIPSDKIIEKVFDFLKNNQSNISLDNANFLFFGKKFNGDIMFLFDKNIRQFFNDFIIYGDTRHNDLFGDRNINKNFENIKKYIHINISKILTFSTSIIDDEIKKMNFIKEIMKPLQTQDLSSNRMLWTVILTQSLNNYLDVLGKVKRTKMLKREKNIIKDIIYSAIIPVGAAVGVYKAIKLVKKKKYFKTPVKKSVKNRSVLKKI